MIDLCVCVRACACARVCECAIVRVCMCVCVFTRVGGMRHECNRPITPSPSVRRLFLPPSMLYLWLESAGDYVQVGGQTGIAQHVTVGHGAKIAVCH